MDGRLRRVRERQEAARAAEAREAESDARPLVVRYIHRGESLRNGRVLPLPRQAAVESVGSSEDAGERELSGEVVLNALGSAAANIPLERLIPYFYSRQHEGWQRLYRRSRIPGEAAVRARTSAALALCAALLL